MPEPTQSFAERLKARFGERALSVVEANGEVTLEVLAHDWADVIRILRDEADFRFEQLMDVCGVDYLSHGDDEWDLSLIHI
jgi:NADH-quinone oxidoreductase subunit C